MGYLIGVPPLPERIDGNLNLITGAMVVEAKAGDAIALDVLPEAAGWLGIAIGNCITLLGPDMVILEGHVGRDAGDALIQPVYEVARAHAYSLPIGGWFPGQEHPIRPSGRWGEFLCSSGPDAGAGGRKWMWQDHHIFAPEWWPSA